MHNNQWTGNKLVLQNVQKAGIMLDTYIYIFILPICPVFCYVTWVIT